MTEKIIGVHLAGDAPELKLSEAQLLGDEFPAFLLRAGQLEVRTSSFQRIEVSCTRKENTFAGGRPTRRTNNGVP